MSKFPVPGPWCVQVTTVPPFDTCGISNAGLPVSTSAVFGIGLLNRTARPRTVTTILLAWVTTLPLSALLGDDRLFGGPGHDRLFGEPGKDCLNASTRYTWTQVVVAVAGVPTIVAGFQGESRTASSIGPCACARS
jgi:hypothetical protein